jgi:cytoskeletal protein RodZ
MALNLNKEGGDKKSNSQTEKKGFNLSKSGDTDKGKPDLSKEKVESTDSISTSPGTSKNGEKKKSPVLYIAAAVLLLGIGAYWFMNQKGNNPEPPVASTNDSTNSAGSGITAISESEQPTQSTAEANSTTATNEQPVASTNSNEGQPSPSSTASNVNTPSTNSPTNSQNTTNSVPSSVPVTQLQGSIEEKARQVISGAFGNGADRKTALGNEYDIIQAKVNELLRSNNR